MKRFLARAVIHRGVIHRLALLSIAGDGTISLEPFSVETHSTTFVDGAVALVTDPVAAARLAARCRSLDDVCSSLDSHNLFLPGDSLLPGSDIIHLQGHL